MLFGLLLLVPLLGAAIGAAAGALVGQLTDIGIGDTCIKRVREEITPGTSPMFVLTSDAVPGPGERGIRRSAHRSAAHRPVPGGGGPAARGLRWLGRSVRETAMLIDDATGATPTRPQA